MDECPARWIGGVVTAAWHRAVSQSAGGPLEDVEVSDESRIGLVLEAAAVLALAARQGLHPQGGSRDFGLGPAGELRVVEPGASSPSTVPQLVLREVLERLFRARGRVAGRGRGRRAARRLQERWAPVAVPFDPDRLVHDVFDEAPFLWDAEAAPARRGLLGRSSSGDGFLCAGPRGVEIRLRRRASTWREAEELLASEAARDLWENVDAGRDDPDRLFERGAWARAARLYRRSAPGDLAATCRRARCLFGLGRYTAALMVLRRRTDPDSELIPIRAQIRLGKIAAARKTLGRLENHGDLSVDQRLDRAEAALRCQTGAGREEGIRDWMARIVAETRGKARVRARLLGAAAAWDLGDPGALDRGLEQTRELAEDPVLGWKWHRTAALQCLSRRDGQGMVEHLASALRTRRRRLSRELAGRIWNEMGVARCLIDDLPGAERACRIALRLLVACEGPGRTSLVLPNLAEVRLRRGRIEGVEATILDALSADRRSRNVRSLEGTYLLWVRLELVRGRPLSALSRLREMREEIAEHGTVASDPVGPLLEARSRGWCGEPERALALLRDLPPEALLELEPEERPAVWWSAGDPEAALEAAKSTSWRRLWTDVLRRDGVPEARWADLDRLEGFRRSRLVLDLELGDPGVVPAARVRAAVARLRSEGVGSLADRLEERGAAPWRAVRRYLEIDDPSRNDAARLLRDAGLGDARVTLRSGDDEVVVVDGPGGPESLGSPVGEGRLELATAVRDEVAGCLLEVLRVHGPLGDLPQPAEVAESGRGVPIGESPPFLEALDRLDRLARSDLPVLLSGETGTGKEVAAKRLHRASLRAAGPFVAVNCAAFTGSLLASELFGHARGAFTGADRQREGVFETGNGGTVFLDEIGDLPLEQQAALLRVLEEQEIRRVGESFARRVDVRIVSATHRDLPRMVEDGAFRNDLLHRIAVATVRLPPLRERGEDVVRLARHFLTEEGRGGHLEPEVEHRLRSHTWPGNVRELRNVVAVAGALAGDRPVRLADLDLPVRDVVGPAGVALGFHARVDQFKERVVREALDLAGGRRSEAARRLDVNRQTLAYLIRKFGIDEDRREG